MQKEKSKRVSHALVFPFLLHRQPAVPPNRGENNSTPSRRPPNLDKLARKPFLESEYEVVYKGGPIFHLIDQRGTIIQTYEGNPERRRDPEVNREKTRGQHVSI